MRKVCLTIKSTTMVPILATYKTVVTVDEGSDLQDIARRIAEGGHLRDCSVEDSGIEEVTVDGNDFPELDLVDQVRDVIQSYTWNYDKVVTKFISAEVTDSK